MLEAFGDDAEGKRLHAGYSVIAIRAVAHDAGQGRHFGKPTAVVLAFELDRKYHWHHCTISLGLVHDACHGRMERRSAVFRPFRQWLTDMSNGISQNSRSTLTPLVAKTARVVASDRTRRVSQEET